ncbi:YbaB/EbfC family nucleoid-associated protein [Patescibacteria group bacterium]|jgi:DNA-binding protein YbaB|nr:YbaB/EbfC family nucleoid-associated protein [Patescibacteria group bacterium]
MFQKLKQLKDMRDQGKQMKAMLDNVIVVGSGLSGKVMITVNGSHETLGVQVEEGLSKADVEKGVKDALTDVNSKLQKELMSKLQEMGGGLDALKNLGLGG